MVALPDSASPLMEQLSFFHDHSMLILAMITALVGYLMTSLFFNTHNFRYLLESQSLEIIWTILPAVTLVFIALPSIRLLYLLDEIINPMISIKTIGHQWYWSYEYSDFKTIEFDSYMKSTNDLKNSDFRLLDVDNRMVVPLLSRVRMMVTAADVIHSWTIPTLGVKIDATPGRLNQVSFSSKRPGLMFGQCSEICGANHSFMPIVMESISINYFIKWLMNN
uniref:Cytochrome c oxidase subunit 2 n=1 Tax=Dermestes coarctatus TaxID=2571046 RepID=A0A5C0XM72_9COLE|nr:cytochrome c oxidase subunit II [Dermestes coarctatus]QEK77742.1 cytochrome c oxidase subunit II [Dermestes coarctatus]